MLKVLDFSADNDHALDSNDEYTSASLDAGFLPESFTICSAIMVDAWTTETARMFTLLRDEDDGVHKYSWGRINLRPGLEPTYEVNLGPARFIKKTTVAVFPLQWTRACLSLNTSKVTLVVDGQLLGEEEYRKEKDFFRPANLRLLLGYNNESHPAFEELSTKVIQFS